MAEGTARQQRPLVKGTHAEYQRVCRRLNVKEGTCGYCGQPRETYRWLCDECARKHREKQREQARLMSIVRTWTSTIASVIEAGGRRGAMEASER